LRRQQREQEPGRYVVHERAWSSFKKLIQRLGKAAKMPFPIHPHMLFALHRAVAGSLPRLLEGLEC
jgi:predicted short-subunit dehydrogenase-like oxidoreductase (DUF2520 family)